MAKSTPREPKKSKGANRLGTKAGAVAKGGKASRSSTSSSKSSPPAPVSPEIVEADLVESDVIEPEIIDPSAPEARGDDRLRFDPGEIAYSSADEDVDPDAEVLNPDADGRRVVAVAPEIVDGDASSKALASTDPVATYLAEIRRYPLLTKEQERELALRYRETGDAKAAELLVTSNLRFVVKIAAEYSRFGAKLIDLIQEGNVGLMHAVKEFNPYRGVRLITYAVWWIRGYIQEYLMRQYSLVRIGTTQNQRKLFYRLQKEREALGLAGHEPNYALLAGRLGVSEEEVETMSKRLSGRDVSLNQPLGDGSSTASLLDFEASAAPGADEEIGHREELDILNENIERIRPGLSEKESYILEHRLLAEEPMTLQEIGEHFGVTREAVRQLEARLIGKLRSAVSESLDPDET